MGAARSGIAAARYLHEHDVSVFVSDTCAAEQLDFTLASNGLAQVAHEAEEHTERVLECEAIVLSPGIRSDLWMLKQAHRRGIPVWSEMELGYRRSTADFLAVTGSSGKSTTVSMLGEIMKASGRPTAVAGNIGTPVIAVAPVLPSDGAVVAEVSSFQLENIDTFKPRVACVINLLANHLDRYVSIDAYHEAKKAIARNMDRTCWLVANACDPLVRQWAVEMAPRTNVAFFGRREEDYPSVWCEQETLVRKHGRGRRKLLDVSEMQVSGRHNYDNASAAAAVAHAVGVDDKAVADGLRAFRGLPHRLQLVGEYAGVCWYNDSKSTTAESVRIAVTAFESPVCLIAGGRDKGCDFTVVNDVLRDHVKQVIVIGEAAARMQSTWQGLVPVLRAASLPEAVRAAAARAAEGDVVVFSPGCSSFDMFRDYEERGTVFMELVRQVAPREAAGARGEEASR
jgi:UDP-N-acetylmuramoylalanine--D-glutamate ligase